MRERAHCRHAALSRRTLHATPAAATLGHRVVLITVLLGIRAAFEIGVEVLTGLLCAYFRGMHRSVSLLVEIGGLLITPVSVVVVMLAQVLLINRLIFVVIAFVRRFEWWPCPR